MTPMLTASKRAFIREFMAIRREVSAVERKRLPTVRAMAERLHCSVSLFYAVANGREYIRVNPRDRVPRGTLTTPTSGEKL